MPDNFHDIIPPERRSIRNVTATHRHPRRSNGREVPEVAEHAPEPPPPPSPPKRPSEGGSRSSFFSRYGLWFIAVAVIVVFILAFSLLFSGSKVAVHPKQRDVFVDGEFEAFRNAEVGQLAYETMSIERTAKRTIPATGEEEAEERASGQIIIFNDFSAEEQRLITNTRFETPDGLIYRIDEPLVVPGQRTEDGETIPGSIEATVYADEPGERYNIGLTDFAIPGFEGSPRFESFYARSKTPMTGGFIGTRLTATESAMEAARAELRTELDRELRAQALAEVPDGFQLFEDAVFLAYEELPSGDSGNMVEIEEKGTLYGVLFRRDDMSRFIASNTIAGYEGEPVEARELDALAFAVMDRETARPWIDDALSFSLTGNTKVIWLYDEARLRGDLAGRAKDALPTVLSGYPSIQEAEVSLRPFWRQTFPEGTGDIDVERVIEE